MLSQAVSGYNLLGESTSHIPGNFRTQDRPSSHNGKPILLRVIDLLPWVSFSLKNHQV